MELIWSKAKAALKDRLPSHSFRMWLEPLKFHQSEDKKITLACPNLFSRRRVLENYHRIIEEEVSKHCGYKVTLKLVIANGSGKSRLKPASDCQLPLPGAYGHLNRGRFLRRDFTFDRFVVSGNNDFAYQAALALASNKRTYQNSLYLLSKTGLGKSHLCQAVGNHIISQYPNERVFYVTAEDFSNEMVDAFRKNTIDQFKRKYRNSCDVLLLEDVHHLPGKKRTQIELAQILDVLMEAGKKIIFSSCYLPSDIPKLNDKLESRLSCGLISNIDAPNFRTRVRILQKKSKINGYDIPEDVIQYLAGELLENVRQLESGLIGVSAKSSLLGIPINLSLAESVVKNLVHSRKKITVNVIKKLVAKSYNVTVRDLVSNSRKQNVLGPRQVAMFLSRQYTDSPLQEIGRSFNRYHATVLHSINSVERKMKENTSVRKQVEILCKQLDEGKF